MNRILDQILADANVSMEFKRHIAAVARLIDRRTARPKRRLICGRTTSTRAAASVGKRLATNAQPMSEASDRMTTIETIKKRLHENRRISEAIDAQELRAWPGLTADQCAAVDEMAGLCDEVQP